MKRNHMFWMIIGCIVPLLLLFLAPAFGLGGNVAFFLFVIAMLVFHLFMPHGHGGHGHNSSSSKKQENEQHQH